MHPASCPGSATQTTTSLYNGMGQRVIRDAANSQTVYVYGQDGYSVISQVQRNLSTSAISTTEHIYLPTASGPMPVAAVIAGKHHAVHSDQLNTPRRLTDSAGAPVWQWAYSAFGEVAAQSLPAAGQAAITYELRYPGQVDDGNGLFYNYHRFYDPLVGRYTSADPIGLEGGWNRFGYVGGNALSGVDPSGLDLVVITGGVRDGSINLAGHIAVGVTDSGLFSYGNNTPLGSSLNSYIGSQSEFRNQTVTIIPTTTAQDRAALAYLLGQLGMNSIGLVENCAVRTNSTLGVAGINNSAAPFPGSVARGAMGSQGAQSYFVPQGAGMPAGLAGALRPFTPPNVP